MHKAVLGLLALGVPLVASAAAGERAIEHGQLGITAASFQSDLRALDRDDKKSSIGFAARRQNFLTTRTAEAGQHTPAGATPSAVAAPEIDPSSAMTGLTLLLGGVAVLRGRKTRASNR